MSGHETRPEMIRRLLDALNRQEVEIAAEAERYKDKRMDEPTDEPETIMRFKYMIEDVVYLKVGVEPVKGMVVGVDIRPTGVVYHVCWGDTRDTKMYFDCELTTEPPIAL